MVGVLKMDEKWCIYCNQKSYPPNQVEWTCPHCNKHNNRPFLAEQKTDNETIMGLFCLKIEDKPVKVIPTLLYYLNKILRPQRIKLKLASMEEMTYVMVVMERV